MTAPPCPAPRPCGSCPYRRDVPSGVWEVKEYLKLPDYDEHETAFQPASAFMCHQSDGRLCAGWVAVHDMDNSLGLRMFVALTPDVTREQVEAICDYTTDVPLWDSGRQAAEHGMSEVEQPGAAARKTIDKLVQRRERK